MRRNLPCLVLVLLIVNPIYLGFIPIISAQQGTSGMFGISETDSTANPSQEIKLQIAIEENITIHENGLCKMELFINVPSSPLAEMYRASLKAPNNTQYDEIIPIPESAPLLNSTEATTPVRTEFCMSITQQQFETLGISVNISESNMMPRSSLDEMRIWLSGDALLPVSRIVDDSSLDKWTIRIGSNNLKQAAGSLFTNVQLVQMMLESLDEGYVYECNWITRIQLPPSASLLNGPEISGLGWTVDFGGGTYANAITRLDGESTVVLEDRMIIAQNPITASNDYLTNVCSRYRMFNIECALPSSESFYAIEQRANCTEDWNYNFTGSWEDSLTYDIPLELPLKASLSVTARLSFTWHVAWDWSWWTGVTMFETWVNLDTSVELSFTVGATASYSTPPWTHSFLTWSKPFFTWVGIFPVEVTVKLDAVGSLAFSAFGRIELSTSITASKSITAGVRWTRENGWRPIWDNPPPETEYSEPTVVAEAGVFMRAGLQIRLGCLFYETTGPFIEFEPYATASASCLWQPPQNPEGEWEITANLRVTAGVSFAGWLKRLLGLSDWSVNLYDQKLFGWEGKWGGGNQQGTNPPGIPGTPAPETTLSTTGNITWAWAAASGGRVEISGYHLQIGTSPGSNDTLDGYVGIARNKTLCFLSGNLTYYARVRAKNVEGLWGNWSAVSEGVFVDKPPIVVITKSARDITGGLVFFEWMGMDDVSSSSELLYSFYLEGYDSVLSPWTPAVNKSYTSLLPKNYTFIVQAKDDRGTINPTPAERSFTVAIGTVSFKPNAFSLNSIRNGWINAYIDLPEGYNVTNIDNSTIKLNYTVPIDPTTSVNITDFDNDTVAELMVKFNGTQIAEFMLSQNVSVGNVMLLITAELKDGMVFEGSDVINVLAQSVLGDINGDNIVDINDMAATALAFGSTSDQPRWNAQADTNHDGIIDVFDLIIVAIHFGETSP